MTSFLGALTAALLLPINAALWVINWLSGSYDVW